MLKHHRGDLKVSGRPADACKKPFPGVMPGAGDVGGQMNPRRERRQDYSPQPQPRETAVKY